MVLSKHSYKNKDSQPMGMIYSIKKAYILANNERLVFDHIYFWPYNFRFCPRLIRNWSIKNLKLFGKGA